MNSIQRKKNRTLLFRHWHLTPYEEAYMRQKELFEYIKAIKLRNKHENLALETPNFLIFTEHPHVYTLGKSGDEAHLLLPRNQLDRYGATFIRTDRGGDITYHGPGQIVGYPIIDLDNFDMDIIRYIRLLEEAVIEVLAGYGLKGERSEGETGVWLEAATPRARKICAIGVRTSRYVTMHGFAFNLNPDLRYFEHIIPCGIRNKGVTSLEKELGFLPPRKEVEAQIRRALARVLGARIVEDFPGGVSANGEA